MWFDGEPILYHFNVLYSRMACNKIRILFDIDFEVEEKNV